MHSFKQWIMGLALAGLCLTICACQPNAVQSKRVNAHDYHSFWLWGNINPAPYLPHATTLYILQGEVGLSRFDQKPYLSAQGMGLVSLQPAKLWLVYRTTTLTWTPQLMQHIVARLESWKYYHNQVIGLQIDFDSPTGQLKQYAVFLQAIRHQLPKRYQLSVTGLLDWVNANTATLHSLKISIDEIIIQTYQNKSTLTHYQAYLPALTRLTIPFKIGLVQHGEWLADSSIEKNPHFKGYVVFLLRQ